MFETTSGSSRPWHTESQGLPVRHDAISAKKRPTGNLNRNDQERIGRVIDTRRSYGIACCRVNKLSKAPEMLLVCKRCTYMYQLFVTGKYTNDARCVHMFNSMTVDEKLDILSLNFAQMWYRLWLSTQTPLDFRGKQKVDTSLEVFRNTLFYKAKQIFETNFVKDGGVKLRKLIGQSKSISRIWEIPKGRKDKASEESITCAIREFEEETGIKKSQYKIFLDETYEYTFIDDGVRYKYVYYLAICPSSVNPIACQPLDQRIGEICKVRWMDINAVRSIDNTEKLAPFIRGLFQAAKKHRQQ